MFYDIKIPATADGDKTKESLRSKFKKDGKTIIGELYDATPDMAAYIEALDSTGIKCRSAACEVPSIMDTLNAGGLCMVPFCVNDQGVPDDSGVDAHWCVVQKNVAHASQKLAEACHWGEKFLFDLDVLRNSNNAIKDVEEQYWGRIPACFYSFSIPMGGLDYVQCQTNADTSVKCRRLLQFSIKPGSVKPIPATSLSQTLAGKMLVFAK